MILKKCNRRETLCRFAAPFFSFISLFGTQTHIHNNLNFKNSVQNQFLNTFKIQFPKNLDLPKFKENQYKKHFQKKSKIRYKIDFYNNKKTAKKIWHIIPETILYMLQLCTNRIPQQA